MVGNSFYRRVLPSPPSIDFASSEGKQLFREAINNNSMEGFYKLISCFQTQSEPAYCGLASLSMVLNALAIDPGRKWKGPWRWFDETMLDFCEPLEKVKAKGISFENVACLARCAGAKVEAHHTNQSTVHKFREFVQKCCASENCHIISSYNRMIFNQTGEGHFSPIGGYHAGKDMALILDVAQFKYPPHWVPLSLLWKAMDTVVEATGLHRGFMLISMLDRAPALLNTLSCRHESWVSIAKFFMEEVPELLGSDNIKDIKDVLSTIFSSLPPDFSEFIKWFVEEKGRLAAKEELLKQLRETNLYKHVTDILSSEKSICTIRANSSHPASNDILTALLLASPSQTWSGIKESKVLHDLQSLSSCDSLPLMLQEEILHLRDQLLHLKRCKENKVSPDEVAVSGISLYGE